MAGRASRPARVPHTVPTIGSVILSTVCALSLTAVLPARGTLPVERFLARQTSPLSYRATRRLEATGSGQRGWLEARTDFTAGAGLDYEVTAEGGSGYIRARVLRTLLEEERRLIARGGSSRVAISAANYVFADDGTGEDGLARVTLRPLRKERPLIIGTMFLRPEDGELVRVEGRLAKSPSFWVSRVHIVRSYERINGALVPVRLESTAQLRLLGRSTLVMTYRYSQIDRQPTRDEQGDTIPNGTPTY